MRLARRTTREQTIVIYRLEIHNKRLGRLTRFMVTALLIVGFCAKAIAEAGGPDYWRVVGVSKGDALNIREKPDAHSEKLGEIPPNGACIANRGCQGVASWVAGRYLAEGGCPR